MMGRLAAGGGLASRLGLCAFIVLAALAAASFVLSAQGRYKLALNSTGSLDGRLFLVDLRGLGRAPEVGDIVAFGYDGSRWDFPERTMWAKRVAGLPGDAIEVRGPEVWVGGRMVGVLDPRVMKVGGVGPVGEGSVPPDSFFVVGSSADSLDSRYGEFGFPATDDLVGTVRKIL